MQNGTPPKDSLGTLSDRAAGLIAEGVERVGKEALRLITVQDGMWVGLLLLLCVLYPLRLLYDGGERVKATRARARSAFGDTVKVTALLFFFTVAGNAIPLLGWLILSSWSGAFLYVLNLAVKAMSKGGADGLGWFGDLLGEAKRRNLQGMQGSRAVPSAGPPDPDAPIDPEEDLGAGGSVEAGGEAYTAGAPPDQAPAAPAPPADALPSAP